MAEVGYLSLICTCAVSRFMSDRVRWLLLLEASNTPESPATLSSLTEGGVLVSQMGERGGAHTSSVGGGASYAGGGGQDSPLSNLSTL